MESSVKLGPTELKEGDYGEVPCGVGTVYQLILIRHGDVDYPGYVSTDPNKVGAYNDIPLTSEGEARALELGRQLKLKYREYEWLRPWSSATIDVQRRPIARSYQTAELLVRAAGEQRVAITDLVRRDLLASEEGRALIAIREELGPAEFRRFMYTDTEVGMAAREMVSLILRTFIEHGRLVALRRPQGARLVQLFVSHDGLFEALLYDVLTPQDREKLMNNEGFIEVPFFATLRVEIRRDHQGKEQISFFWQDEELELNY